MHRVRTLSNNKMLISTILTRYNCLTPTIAVDSVSIALAMGVHRNTLSGLSCVVAVADLLLTVQPTYRATLAVIQSLLTKNRTT